MWQMMALGAGLSLLGANAAASGVTKAGRYNKQIADRNAKVADQKAELRVFRAEQDIVKFRSQYQTLAGQQEVQYNKANIMTGTGTALEVAMKSAEEMDADINNLEYNAKSEAGDYRDQAANMRLQGQLKLFEAKFQAKAMRLQAMGKFAGSMASI
mgnify:FL=1